jgi:hypothetical protein
MRAVHKRTGPTLASGAAAETPARQTPARPPRNPAPAYGSSATPNPAQSPKPQARRTPVDKGKVTEVIPATPRAAQGLHPNRVAIWPVEGEGYGVDFTYHGVTGYSDAEAAQRVLDGHGLRTRFNQELDGAWSVRFGPIPRDAMREVLDRFAW